MKISPVNIISHNYRQNFKSKYRQDLTRGRYLSIWHDEIVNSHETYLFREDINWSAFKDYLISRFGNCPKVQTYIYGCSDGSEPYSLSMLLLSEIKNPQRFFPIIASDIDEDIIKENNKRKNTTETLNKVIPKNINICDFNHCATTYFGIASLYRYEVDKETTSPVEYKCANILEDIDYIDFNFPTLFMCRNMWPYIKNSEYDNFAKRLYQKLPKGSSVVIGSFDYKGNGYTGSDRFPYSLSNNGFKLSFDNISRDIPIKNLVYEKN